MIPRKHNQLALRAQPFEQPARFRGGRAVVHQVAHDHELMRLIFRDQFPQPFMFTFIVAAEHIGPGGQWNECQL